MPTDIPSYPVRVLFLDIDGVLWTPRTLMGQARKASRRIDQPLDQIAINFLDRMCSALGVKLVISSTHRILRSRAELIEWLSPLGEHFHQDHQTKYLSRIRGEEIQEWLDRHSEVTGYAIVDDDDDMLSSQRDRFVEVNDNHNGLSYDEMKQLWKLFADAPGSPGPLDNLQ